MKLTFDCPPELSLRFKRHLLDRYGTTYRVQQLELQKALELYLDKFATPPATIEKKPEKRKVPQEALAPVGNRRPDPRRLEATNPDLAAKILEMAARDVPIRTIAKELHLGRKQIASVIARAKE